jgi:hypothetical protein
LHCQARVVAVASVFVGALLERAMDKGTELAGEILAVEHCYDIARYAKELFREPAIVFLVEELIPTDKTHTVANTRIAACLDRRGYASMGFEPERFRVVAQAVGIVVMFAKDARREPQLADLHAIQQLLKSLYVVLVGVSDGKSRQVGFSIDRRQVLFKVIDDRSTVCFFVFRLLAVPEIDLENNLPGDHDKCRAVTRANRPKEY